MTIGVLLVDDHAAVRRGLALLIQSQADMRVVGQAADGREAVQLALRTGADVVVMDIAMPGLDGVEATRQICERRPDTDVLILSVHADAEHVFRGLRAGALGYLVKESAGAELVAAVRCVHQGSRYLGSKIAQPAMESYLHRRLAASLFDGLNPREREVLVQMAAGKSSAEVAERLGLSVPGVESCSQRTMQRLGIAELSSLLALARAQNLDDQDVARRVSGCRR